MEKPVKPKKQCVSTLLLLSVVLAAITGLTNCEHNANLMQQPAVDCGEVLFADSLFAGRSRVVCQDSTLRSALEHCSRVGLFFAPYIDVTWHPSGDFIAFHYQVMDRIVFQNGDPCRGGQRFIRNTQGYWFSKPDGSNMRRVHAFSFSNPAWSPDGEWLAFDDGAQISKIHFNGHCFDESSLIQLTTEGRNFSPAWSFDGQWLAYRRSFSAPEPFTVQGIWIMKSDGSDSMQVFKGNVGEPSWHPNQNKILFFRGAISLSGESPGDSLWIYSLSEKRSHRFAFFEGLDIHSPKFSPDGASIALGLQAKNGLINLWVMNSDGTDLRQLTTDGSRDWLDWSPDGQKIIYTRHIFTNWTYCNGVLWTVDVRTGEKQQITFNYLPKD